MGLTLTLMPVGPSNTAKAKRADLPINRLIANKFI